MSGERTTFGFGDPDGAGGGERVEMRVPVSSRTERAVPFVIGVLADLSGQAARRPLDQRKFLSIDLDNFDDRLRALNPRVTFAVPNRLAEQGTIDVDLSFESLDDFSPAVVAGRVPQLHAVSTDIMLGPEERYEKLALQLNVVIHHPAFRAMEGMWRGLWRLVRAVNPDAEVRLRLLDVSKRELADALAPRDVADPAATPLGERILAGEEGLDGTEPFGLLVADYAFDHSPADARLLASLGRLGAAALAPVVANVSPALLCLERWDDLPTVEDVAEVLDDVAHAPWRDFRAGDAARFVALALPGVLSRLPYGTKTNPVDGLAFDEDAPPGNTDRFAWTSAALPLAGILADAFRATGWFARIQGMSHGGKLEDLPILIYQDADGDPQMMPPTPVPLSDRVEADLAAGGLTSLAYYRNTDFAVFLTVQSLHRPADAPAGPYKPAHLAYLLGACRFAQGARLLARTAAQSGAGTPDTQRLLAAWLADHTSATPTARQPLAESQVALAESPSPTATLHLRPRHHLPGLDAPLRLEFPLPH